MKRRTFLQSTQAADKGSKKYDIDSHPDCEAIRRIQGWPETHAFTERICREHPLGQGVEQEMLRLIGNAFWVNREQSEYTRQGHCESEGQQP